MKTALLALLLLTAACHRPSTQLAATLTPTTGPEATTIPDYSRQLKAGDELLAQGNDPAWSLTINATKNELRFTSSTGDSVRTAAPARSTDSDGSFRYETPAQTDRLTVLFAPDSCVDKLSRQRFDYRVEVDVRGRTYAGCGVSLRQATLLGTSWVLTTFGGTAVAAGGPRGEVPRLTISTVDGRVTGTTGCNRLNGRVRADGQRVQFGPLATTRVACAGEAAQFETAFLKALQEPLTYRIGEGRLTLLRVGRPVMAFTKAD